MEKYLLEQLETIEDGLEQLLIFPNQRGLERSWRQLSQLFLDEETYFSQSSERRIKIADDPLRRILSDTQQKLTELYQQEITNNGQPVQQSITSC